MSLKIVTIEDRVKKVYRREDADGARIYSFSVLLVISSKTANTPPTGYFMVPISEGKLVIGAPVLSNIGNLIFVRQ